MKLVWITDAGYMDGYRLALTFNDGSRKIFDLPDRHCAGIPVGAWRGCVGEADLKPTGEVECSGRNGLPVVSVGDVT